ADRKWRRGRSRPESTSGTTKDPRLTQMAPGLLLCETGGGGQTMETLDAQRIAQVSLDYSSLKAESEGSDTRYTVALSGRPDPVWIDDYRLAQAESTGYRRFRLDPANRTVSFVCRSVEGPAQVFGVLE